ncbi:M20 family metallopeptidase [Halalkalibacter krulwichiae]|uniref:Probable succinyl-diaminopimelate desuccinylase n=1 Tax=Halalkalibacter krulwichiae TaxID=199441 RepID=A0A1X9MJE0_9BACI|nr:M20 family metallopeptidase [Halalkalibacter krulwichiae]ARK32413.1 putative succinyl-diaminopimelate desuccinylase [Halalkalibacter krulwichiae]
MSGHIDVLKTKVDPTEVIDLTCDLIQIESHQDHDGHEKDVTYFIKDYLEKEGIEVELQEVVDGRSNVIARVRGDGSGPTLLLNGHTDTVPPYEMENAFEPKIEDGKIFGRGSVDMKGALAAMISVLVAIKRSNVSLRGDVMFAATIGEENYSPGAYHFLKSGLDADFAIVGEPTGMNVGIAHKGVVWGEAIFEGKSVHGSVPDKGINAIYKATAWIGKITSEYIPELNKRGHPILGKPTINIGEINGGTRPVIVPNQCVVKFEQRLLPNEKEETVLGDLQALIDQLAEYDPDMKGTVKELPVFKGVPHRALEADPDSVLVKALCKAYEKVFESSTEPVGLQFWTDGALIGDIPGIQTVVCGPGSIEQAHSNEEYISKEQLLAAFQMYLEVAETLCVKGNEK